MEVSETLKESEGGPSDLFVLLWGLSLAEPALDLGNSLVIKRLESRMTLWDLLAAGASGFGASSLLQAIADDCTCEIQAGSAPLGVPGYDTVNRAWLVSALLVLRGFTRHLGVAVNHYSWDVIAGHHERNQETRARLEAEGVPWGQRPPFIANVPPFKGNLLDFHLRLVLGSQWREDAMLPEDAAWLADRFATANSLATNEQFHFALAACTDFRVQEDARSAIARLWSGIEALLRIENELTFRIALSCASLLEDRGEARSRRFKSIQKLYDRRSKAVHGGQISQDDITNTIDYSFELLRDLLVLCIDQGKVISRDDIEKASFIKPSSHLSPLCDYRGLRPESAVLYAVLAWARSLTEGGHCDG